MPTVLRTYIVWSTKHPSEYIEAETGYDARKKFAIAHQLSINEVMSRVSSLTHARLL